MPTLTGILDGSGNLTLVPSSDLTAGTYVAKARQGSGGVWSAYSAGVTFTVTGDGGGGGTDPVDPGADPVSAFQPEAYLAQTVPTTPVTGVVFAPSIARKSVDADIQGIRFFSPATIIARPHSFGMTFPRGVVDPAEATGYIADLGGGVTTPIQIDAKRFWDDGTVKNGSVSCLAPALTANVAKEAMLKKSGSGGGTAVDLMNAVATMFTGSITVVSSKVAATYSGSGFTDNGAVTAIGQTTDISPDTLRSAITPVYWRQGPICTEARFEKRLTQGLRVLLNMRAYNNLDIVVDYQICADLQRWSNPTNIGSWFINLNLKRSGTDILNLTNFRIGVGQKFHKVMYSFLTATENQQAFPPIPYVQYDSAVWMQHGILPNYDLQTGLNNTKLAEYGSQAAGFRTPLNTAGLPQGMGGTGNRFELGIMPSPAEGWCVTQDYRAYQVMVAQAEASGAVPWNFYDATKNVTLNNFPDIGYPGMWMDYRGQADQTNVNPTNITLMDWGWTGWMIDMAHQPITTYTTYLATGDQFFADLLEQFASFNIIDQAPYARYRTGDKDWLITQGNQVREAGWRPCAVAQACAALPATSPFVSRFYDLLEYNFAYLVGKQAAWSAAEGEVAGLHAGVDADPLDQVKPWMDDHATAGMAMCAILAGIPSAFTHLTWKSNWNVGRMLQDQAVFSFKRGSYYTAVVGDARTPVFNHNLWSTFGQDLFPPAEGLVNGFANGNYGQLACRSIALHDILGNTDQGRTIIDMHIDGGCPAMTLTERRVEAKDYLVPLARSGAIIAPNPGINANQVFTNPADMAANGAIGTVLTTGGPMDSMSIDDAKYNITSGGALTLASVWADTTVAHNTTPTVTATKGGVTVTRQIAVNFTAVAPGGGGGEEEPPVTGSTPYNAPSTTFYQRSAVRQTKPAYASTMLTLATIAAPVVSQTFALDSNGNVDKAAITTWLSTRASGQRETGVAGWNDMDHAGRAWTPESVARQPRFTKPDGTFYELTGGTAGVPCIAITAEGQGLRQVLTDFPTSMNIGASVTFEITGPKVPYARILNFMANGQTGDFDNGGSISFIDQSDQEKFQVEKNNTTAPMADVATGAAITLTWFAPAGGTVKYWINNADSYTDTGTTLDQTALAASGIMRLGYYDESGGVGGFLMKISEVAVFTVTTLADAEAIHFNNYNYNVAG